MKRALALLVLVTSACASPSSIASSPETSAIPTAPIPSATQVAATPVSASAAQKAVPPPDWKAELAWARATYPEIAALRAEVDPGPLLAWVSKDREAVLYMTAGPHRCAEVSATRAPDDERAIDLVIRMPERVIAGRRSREVILGRAGESLRFGFAGGTEELGADGKWVETGGWGSSGAGTGGFLLSVEGDVARYEAESVRVLPKCGPFVDVPCASGGTHSCNACERIQFDFTVLGGALGVIPGRGQSADTCSVPCAPVDNADLARLRALFDHHETMLREQTGDAPRPVSRLFRTKTACASDRPAP